MSRMVVLKTKTRINESTDCIEHVQSNIFVFKSKRPSILLLNIRGFELYGIHRLRDTMNGPNGYFEVSMETNV
jgi:hypothetical protein